jgi:serine/threonine-protein kinase
MTPTEPLTRETPEQLQSANSQRIRLCRVMAHSAQIGRIFGGRYRLEAEVGSGAMGKVYQALDLKRQQRVAIKLVQPGARSELQAHLRIANEAQVASQLYHPNIISVQEFHRDTDGTEFLVLELLDGMDLHEHLSLYGRMPLGRALPVLRGVALALQYAHDLGIVHCDIKPENVFLCRQRGAHGYIREAVKVLDFGLARVLREPPGSSKDPLTQGLALGTREYMAPELLVEDAVVDARSDQWSLAVLAYELLSGQLPFKPSYQLRQHIRMTEPRPLSQLVPQLPEHVERAIATALSKQPERRHVTVAHFLRALEGLPQPDAPADQDLPAGDTLGRVQPDLRAEHTRWVHQEDLADKPAAPRPDVLQTVQYSADELLALASQSLTASNVPQEVPEDSPTKPYVVTEADLLPRATPPAPLAAAAPPVPLLPIATEPPADALPALPLATPRSDAMPAAAAPPPLPFELPAAAAVRTPHAAASRALWVPPRHRERSAWFTIGAGSALFCLGVLVALIWSARHPHPQRGHLPRAWDRSTATAALRLTPPPMQASCARTVPGARLVVHT